MGRVITSIAWEEKPESPKTESKRAEVEQAIPIAIANSRSGSLRIMGLRLSNGNKACGTLAIGDTGSLLSFVHATLEWRKNFRHTVPA